MEKVIHRITVDLQGLKKWSWHKNLRGFFSINGEKLEDAEVRELVDWAIKKGYKTDSDIPDEEAIALLQQRKERLRQPNNQLDIF